jgi:integrase
VEALVHWCEAHALEPLPAAPEAVALYLSALAQAGRKRATLELALAALNRAHQLAGHAAPGASELVRDTMQGIRRAHGSAQRQKAPLLAAQLRTVLAALPSTLLGARDRALLLVGFAGGFRRSELVALERADLAFTMEGLAITLRRSKTDQEGEGRKLGLPYGSAAATCPVRATLTWLVLAGITEGRVFRSVDRHGRLGVELGAQDVARIVKRRASAVGLDAAHLAGHSLRAGLVTSAAKAGKALHTIMKTTGHRSADMVQRYIRDAELFDDNAAAGLL